MKRLSILGSTGSIGQNVLNIVRMFPDRFSIKALAAKKNINLLALQIKEFRPEIAVVYDKSAADELRIMAGRDTDILHGEEGYLTAAAWDSADMLISSMVGGAGLIPTLTAIDAGKTIALANKETLVMAGEIVMKRAAEKCVNILPIDSEHSAIFQCLHGNSIKDLRKILLTGSGGPFLCKSENEFDKIKPEDALNHPTWDMGDKISVDSATLMNKGLEVIEAKHLFGISLDMIEVLIHPQSIVHSMVSFKDGSVMAQMGMPDMKGAIAYAMSYPERLPLNLSAPNFTGLGALTFEKPDMEKFPCLKLAFLACNIGGTLPSVLNGANEVTVHAFLNQGLAFNQIPIIIKDTMDKHCVIKNPELLDILNADKWARAYTEETVNRVLLTDQLTPEQI